MRHPEGTKTIKGTLTKVSDDAIELKLANGEEYRIPFDAIEESKVVLPW
jgi:ribosome maturation factor RimP